MYNGSRILGSQGPRVSLDTFLRAFCCRIAMFLIKPDYGPVVGARDDQEGLQEQDVNLINMESAWTKVDPDTCGTRGPTSTDERMKLADCSVD